MRKTTSNFILCFSITILFLIFLGYLASVNNYDVALVIALIALAISLGNFYFKAFDELTGNREISVEYQYDSSSIDLDKHTCDVSFTIELKNHTKKQWVVKKINVITTPWESNEYERRMYHLLHELIKISPGDVNIDTYSIKLPVKKMQYCISANDDDEEKMVTSKWSYLHPFGQIAWYIVMMKYGKEKVKNWYKQNVEQKDDILNRMDSAEFMFDCMKETTAPSMRVGEAEGPAEERKGGKP